MATSGRTGGWAANYTKELTFCFLPFSVFLLYFVDGGVRTLGDECFFVWVPNPSYVCM